MKNTAKEICMLFFDSRIHLAFIAFFLIGASGCQDKTTSQQTLEGRKTLTKDDLIQKREHAKKLENKELEGVALEQLINQYADDHMAKSWRLELGKIYDDLEKMKLSYRAYRDYEKLFPNDIRTEEASFLAITAQYKQTVKMPGECDTKEARKTIKLCQRYLNNPLYKKYKNDVQDILSTCESRILNKDSYILETYLIQGKTTSARTRLDTMKEKYIGKIADAEPQCLYLEYKLAKAEKKNDLAKNLFADLQAKYPSSTYSKMAQSQVKKLA
jgi:outer membrane protein assembly factor BamD (BamD/ComL family)